MYQLLYAHHDVDAGDVRCQCAAGPYGYYMGGGGGGGGGSSSLTTSDLMTSPAVVNGSASTGGTLLQAVNRC